MGISYEQCDNCKQCYGDYGDNYPHPCEHGHEVCPGCIEQHMAEHGKECCVNNCDIGEDSYDPAEYEGYHLMMKSRGEWDAVWMVENCPVCAAGGTEVEQLTAEVARLKAQLNTTKEN